MIWGNWEVCHCLAIFVNNDVVSAMDVKKSVQEENLEDVRDGDAVDRV